MEHRLLRLLLNDDGMQERYNRKRALHEEMQQRALSSLLKPTSVASPARGSASHPPASPVGPNQPVADGPAAHPPAGPDAHSPAAHPEGPATHSSAGPATHPLAGSAQPDEYPALPPGTWFGFHANNPYGTKALNNRSEWAKEWLFRQCELPDHSYTRLAVTSLIARDLQTHLRLVEGVGDEDDGSDGSNADGSNADGSNE